MDTVTTAESDNPDDTFDPDTVFLNTIDGNSKKSDTSWNVMITIANTQIPFKVDTGAEVSAMSESAWQEIRETFQLSKTKQKLYGPDHQPLDIIGTTTLSLSFKGNTCTQPVFIIRNLRNNLLGLPAIKLLQIIPVQLDTIGKNIPDQFPDLFTGLGTMEGQYTIKLKPGAKPFAIYTPRSTPLPLRDKVQAELTKMEQMGVISKVQTPTPWCAAMVVVPKTSGGVRICVDLKPLNKSVLREVHPLPKVETTLAQLSGATVFSKIDTNSGFWQIPLDPSSRLLTTFLTPFGRFCYNKLPFGIASAPEHFQRRMTSMLEGLPGVVCHIDDILIYGKDQQEHDERLRSTLLVIRQAGLTLNCKKCQFSKSSLSFLGYIVNSQGIAQDPQKTRAITEIKPPTTVTQMRRFLGMINQMNRFSPKIAELSQPLRELLSTKKAWTWGPPQQESFEKLKAEIATPQVLAHYNVTAETKICADASSHGLGAVLLQKQGRLWKPVAFASRSLSSTEQRYAQIEKEALALTWACEKFSEYIIGKEIILETDHKPLIPLLGDKSLDSLPPRVLRFRLRLMRFQYSIYHVPGKEMYTPDTLSRAPLPTQLDTLECEALEETEKFVQTLIESLPAHKDRLNEYRQNQTTDEICAQLNTFCRSGWPKQKPKGLISKFWQFQGKISISDDLLLYGSRIVVPETMRTETLEKIHRGHQGIQKCYLRAKTAVWWPGISKDINNFISSCAECKKHAILPREPLIQTPLPNFPWERIACDLFELEKTTYILVVDYFSRYVEVQKLTSTTSTSIISTLKAVFSRHGVPVTLVTDNGPQFASAEMSQFSTTYGFTHITSSPHYHQANGLAERTVRTIKTMLKKSSDPYLALLSYRSTPLPWCQLSPAQLLMGRTLRTDVPQLTKNYQPEWQYLTDFRQREEKYRDDQKRNYNDRHRSKDLVQLPNN